MGCNRGPDGKTSYFDERRQTVRAAIEQRKQQIAAIPGRIEAEKAKADETRAMYAQRVESARILYEKAIAEQKEAEQKIADVYNANVAAIEAERADYESRKANGEDWIKRYEANNPENTGIR